MRIDGEHDSYDFEDDHFAKGGAAKLYRGRKYKLVYKKYLKPISDAEPTRQLLHLANIGRTVLQNGAKPLGNSPQTSVCWPTDVHRDGTGAIDGVVMPVIPAEFFRPNKKARTLDFLIMARAAPPRASVRVSVLIRVAEIFAWLASNDLVHGDFSDGNIVWTEAPAPAALLIDADGLQPKDRIAPVGMKTPHWIDPRAVAGEINAHDHYSDWYALALAMYRGLLLIQGNLDRRSDLTWPKPIQIPVDFPSPLNALLQRTLSDPLNETRRAAPEEWVSALRDAFLLNDHQFNGDALRDLDAAADRNRPPAAGPSTGRTTFQPLPIIPATPTAPPAQIQPMVHYVWTRPSPPQTVSRRAGPAALTGKVAGGTAAIVVLILVLVSLLGQGGGTTTAGGGTDNQGFGAATPSTMATTTEVDPAVFLRQQADADAPAVEALVGGWVPQLSSKAIGTQADGIVYDNAAIAAHYRSVKSRFPSALLLLSDSYPTFSRKGYWVIILSQGYGSGADANAWCDSMGIDADNCFAKFISHTAGPQGATLNR